MGAVSQQRGLRHVGHCKAITTWISRLLLATWPVGPAGIKGRVICVTQRRVSVGTDGCGAGAPERVAEMLLDPGHYLPDTSQLCLPWLARKVSGNWDRHRTITLSLVAPAVFACIACES
jgi:hypothetical protein